MEIGCTSSRTDRIGNPGHHGGGMRGDRVHFTILIINGHFAGQINIAIISIDSKF